MTRERIDALEKDKGQLQAEVARLQGVVDKLTPVESRLTEALRNAESNSTLATILIAVSGFSVSYATFAGRAATAWANIAAGSLIAGIVMLLWQSASRWRRR
jgi:hypothetical protein